MNFKKIICFILMCITCLSLCACGGSKASKEDMLLNATMVYAHDITLDIAGNKAKAKNYEGKTYHITGHVLEIEENYCLVIAKSVEGDNHEYLHSDDWYGFNCDTVFKVFLTTEELANINLCDGIEFVGIIDEVGTQKYHAIEDQIYLSFKNAYYIASTEYEGGYRLD